MISMGKVLEGEPKCSVPYRFMILSYEVHDYYRASLSTREEVRIALADLITMIRALAWQVGLKDFDDWLEEDKEKGYWSDKDVFRLAKCLARKYRFGENTDAEIMECLKKLARGVRYLAEMHNFMFWELVDLGEKRVMEKIKSYKKVWREL
jgi:hypothetical protein